MVDTLGNQLHNEIKELKEIIEKVKQNISEIVEKLVIVKKVQVLLGELSNYQVPGLMCGHRYIVPDFHYKQVILIETKSALPSHYTASIKGENFLKKVILTLLLFDFAIIFTYLIHEKLLTSYRAYT